MTDEDGFFDLTAEEQRVLGCLIEKEATVPDTYPLTLNSLRTACNQSTSRDPVVSFDDHTIERTLTSLRTRGVTRTVHSTSNRATKFRHVAPDAYGLDAAELALVCVLLLRGAQTAGELKVRTERQHRFRDADSVERTLAALAGRERPLARELERRPGHKETRWIHLLGDVADTVPAVPSVPAVSAGSASAPRVAVLRVARAVSDVDTLAAQYADGLGWAVLAEWRDHDGVDGAVLGVPGGPYHVEFVHDHHQPDPPAPHHEHLIALYLADDEWAGACDRLVAAGFDPVVNANRYWEAHGRTFADLDGGLLVLHRGPWPT